MLTPMPMPTTTMTTASLVTPTPADATIPITEVHITLPPPGSDDRLLGYARIVLGGAFVVYGLRLIRAATGRLFVAMPSKRPRRRCPCGQSCEARAEYCQQCGVALPDRGNCDYGPHLDIAWPITQAMRASLETAVIRAYHQAAGMPRDDGAEAVRLDPAG